MQNLQHKIFEHGFDSPSPNNVQNDCVDVGFPYLLPLQEFPYAAPYLEEVEVHKP